MASWWRSRRRRTDRGYCSSARSSPCRKRLMLFSPRSTNTRRLQRRITVQICAPPLGFRNKNRQMTTTVVRRKAVLKHSRLGAHASPAGSESAAAHFRVTSFRRGHNLAKPLFAALLFGPCSKAPKAKEPSRPHVFQASQNATPFTVFTGCANFSNTTVVQKVLLSNMYALKHCGSAERNAR